MLDIYACTCAYCLANIVVVDAKFNNGAAMSSVSNQGLTCAEFCTGLGLPKRAYD